jgi:phosphate/sulfate permease
MTQKELLTHVLATAMMFLTLLGAVGCMTWHQAITSVVGDVASTIDPSQSAQAKCEDFTCEP